MLNNTLKIDVTTMNAREVMRVLDDHLSRPVWACGYGINKYHMTPMREWHDDILKSLDSRMQTIVDFIWCSPEMSSRFSEDDLDRMHDAMVDRLWKHRNGTRKLFGYNFR